jgi:hypothetical protein
MLDTSTIPFGTYQNQVNARTATILKLTDGVSTWYVGDMEIDWGAVHVYGILKTHSGILHKIDPFAKDWSIGEVTVILSNLPWQRSGSSWKRPSDIMHNIDDDAAELYLLCGETATGTADCLLRFDGFVKGRPVYDEHDMKIVLEDRGANEFNELIPNTTVGSVYSLAPPETYDKHIPIVYGDFTHDWDDNETGLAKGLMTDTGKTPLYVFSNHVLNAFEEMLIDHPDFPDPAFYLSRTLFADDSGRGTGEIDAMGVEIYILPNQHNTSGYSFAGDNAPDDEQNAWDKDDTSFAKIKDIVSDDGATAIGRGVWSFDLDDEVFELLQHALVDSDGGNVGIRYKINPHSGVTLSSVAAALWYASDGATDTNQAYSVTADNTWRNTTGATAAAIATGKNKRYLIGFTPQSTANADGTPDNLQLLDVYESWLRVQYNPPHPYELWGDLKGREYGSWITGRGHSSGDLIEDPASIIESILREELGFTDAMIDEDSFDAAENASVKARINFTTENRMTVRTAIKLLAEQSTFVFFFSTLDKAKMIDLDAMGSTVRTIPYSHVIPGSVRVSTPPPKFNKLHVHSRYWPQKNKYKDKTTYTGGGTITREGEVFWPNISGSSRVEVAGNYMTRVATPPKAIWSLGKITIEFETIKFTNADIEVGDYIELEDVSWDAQVKRYADTSWSGNQLLVVTVDQKIDRTRIKAVEIA